MQPPGTTPPVPPKGEEIKKTDEPSKPATDTKTAPTTGTATPAKADETKKPTEPVKPTDEKKPAEPSKATGGDKPPVGATPPDEEDLPKNLHITLTQPGQPESVVTLPLTDIHVFEGHPFNVNDDKDMWDLVESIKQFGVLKPAVVIPCKEGGYSRPLMNTFSFTVPDGFN